MKSHIIAVAMSGLLTASAFAADIVGQTSTINFTGKIIADTCKIDTNVSNVDNVDLGTWAAQYFTSSTTMTDPVKVSIAMEANSCPQGISQFKVRFNGETKGTAEQLNANTDVTNVAVILTDASGDKIKWDGSNTSTVVDIDKPLELNARYIQAGDAVSAGDASATASFTVIYP